MSRGRRLADARGIKHNVLVFDAFDEKTGENFIALEKGAEGKIAALIVDSVTRCPRR